MRLRQILEQKKLNGRILAKKLGTDEGAVSRIVNYKVLPVPADLDRLCDLLGVGVLDIYDKEEIRLIPKRKRRVRGDRGYNLCIFVDEKYRTALPAAINALGIRTYSEWLRPYIEETIKRGADAKFANKKEE